MYSHLKHVKRIIWRRKFHGDIKKICTYMYMHLHVYALACICMHSIFQLILPFQSHTKSHFATDSEISFNWYALKLCGILFPKVPTLLQAPKFYLPANSLNIVSISFSSLIDFFFFFFLKKKKKEKKKKNTTHFLMFSSMF